MIARRPSVGWLICLVLAASAGAVVMTLVPLRKCRTCNAVAQDLSRQKCGADARAPIYCPDCGDRGTISLVKSLRTPTVNTQVGAIIALQNKSKGIGSIRELRQLIEAQGLKADEFMGDSFAGEADSGSAHFLDAESKKYVIVLLHSMDKKASWNTTASARIVLLSTSGQVLDYIHCIRAHPDFSIYAWRIDEPAPDGARVMIIKASPLRNPAESRVQYDLHYIGSGPETYHGSVEWLGGKDDGFCRIAVRNDHLEIVRPETGKLR